MNTLALLLANVTANTGAHVSLKRSAISSTVKRFLFWQVVGNLAAFLGTIAYTALLRGMSLHVAYPLTEGLSAVSVQVVGAAILFREHVTPLAWAGTGLILSGIVLFSL
jgi:multidrug transporter EmrE-like cation transporter